MAKLGFLIIALGCVGLFVLAAVAPLTVDQQGAAMCGGLVLVLPAVILGVIVLDE